MAKMYEEINLKKEAHYIYSTPFLTEDFCKYLIKRCDKLGTWESASDEPEFATSDIYLRTELPEAFHHLCSGLNTLVYPPAKEAFKIEEIETPYTIFALKYSLGAQTSLKLHKDDSYISGSIKLNDDYEGAELIFPEEDFSNKDVPVGHIILWPASVTHPHKVTELTKGMKYSITIWTPFPENGEDADISDRGRYK